MTIFHFALKRSFGNRANLLFLTLFPIACIFLPSGEGWPFLPYGYQYFGIFILFASIRLAAIMLEDRAKGVVKRLAVAPVSHLRYISQNLLAYLCIMVVQCAVVVIGGLLYGQQLYQPAWLMLLYISFSAASLAVALAWISLYRNKEISFLVFMPIVFLVAILGGIMMPVDIFPEGLRRLAVVFPTYWLAKGLDWIAFGESIGPFLLVNGVLWLYAVVFVIMGSARKIE